MKTLIAAAGVLALSISVPAALMASAALAATTPVVYASGVGGWGHPSVRPSWILVGTGGAPGAHTWYWSAWDKGEPAPHATSTGTLWVDSCIPNCAQGKESYHHLVVTLSVVRTHNGVRYYSQMTWYTPGYRLYGYRTSTAVLHYSVTRGTVPYWHRSVRGRRAGYGPGRCPRAAPLGEAALVLVLARAARRLSA